MDPQDNSPLENENIRGNPEPLLLPIHLHYDPIYGPGLDCYQISNPNSVSPRYLEPELSHPTNLCISYELILPNKGYRWLPDPQGIPQARYNTRLLHSICPKSVSSMHVILTMKNILAIFTLLVLTSNRILLFIISYSIILYKDKSVYFSCHLFFDLNWPIPLHTDVKSILIITIFTFNSMWKVVKR